MNEDSVLDPTRLWLLIRNDLLMSVSSIKMVRQAIRYKTFVLIGIVLAVVSADIYWLSLSGPGSISQDVLRVLHGLSLGILFFFGLLLTSGIFGNLYDSEKSYACLTFPGSLLEKYISRLVLTSIGYLLAATAVYAFLVAVLTVVSRSILNHGSVPFNPFSGILIDTVAVYISLHSLYALGSITLGKLSFPRTTIIVSILFAVCAKVFYSYMQAHGVTHHTDPQMDTTWLVIRIAFVGIVMPAAWVTGYLLLKRKEA